MKKTLLLLFFVVLNTLSWSQSSPTMEGDLYFGLWRYGSLYKQPKKVVKWVEKMAESKRRDTLDPTSQDILRIYDILQQENKLYMPYVQLKLDDNSIVRIYLEKSVYKKIKTHTIDELQEKKQKVRIQLEYRQMADDLFYCKKLIQVDLRHGETLQRQRKFAIEDYP